MAILNQVAEMQIGFPIVRTLTSPGYVDLIFNNTSVAWDYVITGVTVLNNSVNQNTFDIYFRDNANGNECYLVKNMVINNYETKHPITEQNPVYILYNSTSRGLRFSSSSNPVNFNIHVNFYKVKQ